jgi:hypothetical protein
MSSTCKFTEIERTFETEHKVTHSATPQHPHPLTVRQVTMDTLHALLCFNGAELARALWGTMNDDASNQLYQFDANFHIL